MAKKVTLTLSLLIILFLADLITPKPVSACGSFTCTCGRTDWCPFTATVGASRCCDQNDKEIGSESCEFQDGCSCMVTNQCAGNPPPPPDQPTPTACPNPAPPTLSFPADRATFILPTEPNTLFVDQIITGISQSCGPNAPEYNITFGFIDAVNPWERGWDPSLIWRTGPYGRTGTVSWKAKSRYLDSHYSTYRESSWTNPRTYQVVTPTPSPTVTPAQTCDAVALDWDPCYNSTRPAGLCQDASIRLRGQLTNRGNSISNISYNVTDYNGTVIYPGESLSLSPNQIKDFNNTQPPQDPGGTYPDYGAVYCGGLKLNVFCNGKPDANSLNNELSMANPIPPCQIATPTPTATPTNVPVLEAWFQTQEGDVHAGGKIASAIPTTAPNRNFSLFGLAGSPGIISYNGNQPDFGRGFASANDLRHWVVKTPATTKNFSYFYDLLGSPTANFGGGELPRDTGVYYSDHDIAISSIAGGSVGSSKRIVILVRGKVDLGVDINIPEGRQSSLVVIASGDIKVANSVTQLAGIYVADGLIDTGNAVSQLRVEGAFISGTFQFRRDLGAANRNRPAELFVNRPDFFIYSSPVLWRQTFMSWEELIP